MGDSSSSSSSSSSSTSSSNLGPLGINPLHFSATLFGLLFLFVLYLLLPKGIRVKYFGAYPKRYAWSARSRLSLSSGGSGGGGGGRQSSSATGTTAAAAARKTSSTPYDGTLTPNYGGDRSGIVSGVTPLSALSSTNNINNNQRSVIGGGGSSLLPHTTTTATTTTADAAASSSLLVSGAGATGNNEDIVVSAAMQQLRDPGVLIVAHGSRGKPKTVRLVLTESAITWRTEMRKKSAVHGGKELKLGKLHHVSLQHIMYVDIGKQTTALRRVENSAVLESLCFSLLTKEGSLDLEANSPRERDALVQCFSLVLDEVHAQNWRDIYRGPSSDMPSSFDEGENNNNKIT
jgi:hypothetical protein